MPNGNDTGGPSRRKLLQMAGIGTAGLLAGCSGDGGDGDGNTENDSSDGSGGDKTDTTTNEDSSDQMVDITFWNGSWDLPADTQWNPYNPSNFSGHDSMILFNRLAEFNNKSEEFMPVLASEWSVDGETMTITLREQSWHDGKSITAEDLVTQLRIEKHLDYPLWTYASEAQTADERTVELALDGTVNANVLLPTILSKRLWAPPQQFKQFRTRFEEASSEEETKAVQEDLTSTVIEEPIGNGIFKFDYANEQELMTVLNEDHPHADELNFPRYGFKHLPTNQQRWAATKSDQIDAHSTFVPPDVVESFPEHWVEVFYPWYNDYSITFNHTTPIYSKRKVRQAWAHIVDRKAVANTIGPHRAPIDVITGTSIRATEKYLSDVIGDFNQYEKDHDKATSLLNEAGFTKEGGQWITPDGNPYSVEVPAPSCCSDYVQGTQMVAQQLKEFGFNANMVNVGGGAFWTRYTDGKYATSVNTWGSTRLYPYFDYQKNFGGDRGDTGKSYQFPNEVSVPMPVGDSEGSSKTIDVKARVIELSKTQDDAAAKEIIQELAWVYNQTLPRLQISDRIEVQAWLTNDDWDFPAKDDPAMNVNRPDFFLHQTGNIKAKSQK